MRFHIIMVAMTAALVFSWLSTGSILLEIALIGGVDWLLINLLNRLTDLKEDIANHIRGIERVSGNQRAFIISWVLVFIGSFVWSSVRLPELTPWRIAVQLIGLGYSISMVPTFRGLRRFKDLYFFKNFMSSVLFVLTVFIYPRVVTDWALILPGGFEAWCLLIVFFVAFELTYEILYDMRDLTGDTLANVPTYPVVHGMLTSRRIIDGLLVLASSCLVFGLIRGTLGLREGLMLAAPAIQFAFYRPRFRRGLTGDDCVWLTHLGTGLLVIYLLGNELWLRSGLPENIFLH
jgi:4-hydroxybenzoate polyprenyltransferase